MDINSSASSLYGQYQSLVDRYKSGSVTYQEAFAEHSKLAPQTRDLIGMGTITGATERGPIRVNISVEAEQQIRAYLAEQDSQNIGEHQYVAKIYNDMTASQGGRNEYANERGNHDDSGSEHMTWTTGNITVSPTLASLSDIAAQRGQYIQDLRGEFNSAAFDHLATYANDNKSEWMAAAKELGISAEGGM